MRTHLVALLLMVTLLLTLGVLGLKASPAIAVEPSGPFCTKITPFNEILEVFILPSGGANFLLSGQDVSTGVPLSGTGFVSGDNFVFVVSGNSATGTVGELLVFDGTTNLTTGAGTGKCHLVGSNAGCGTGTSLTYTAVACP